MSNFCQRSYHRKCKRRWEGDQKKPQSCQRSLWMPPMEFHDEQEKKSGRNQFVCDYWLRTFKTVNFGHSKFSGSYRNIYIEKLGWFIYLCKKYYYVQEDWTKAGKTWPTHLCGQKLRIFSALISWLMRNQWTFSKAMNIWWCPNTSIHLFPKERCHSRFHFCSSYLDRSIKLDVSLVWPASQYLKL